MSYIRKDDYSQERERPKILTGYFEQMSHYLKTTHPEATQEEIEAFVRKTMHERMQVPQVEYIYHKREGFSDVSEMRLDDFTRKIVGTNNLVPSGSCFHPVSEKESFLRITIDSKIKERSAFKHKGFEYKSQGMKREADYYNLAQANAKIFNNAIAGGMNVSQFILGSVANFNAITSVGRMSVKQGYSFIERAVNGNIYLPTLADAISYVITHARHIPDEYKTLYASGTLYIPTVEDVQNYLHSSLKNYVYRYNENHLRTVLTGLTELERHYVFYVGCFSNLCKFNEDIMRPWIDSCFIQGDIDPSLTQDIDVAEIKSFRDDIVACILSTDYKRLGEKPGKPGQWNSPKDAMANNPQGLKDFIYVCRNFVKQFESFLPILRPILHIEATFTHMTFQHRMARETVPLSDTDSNIFSTQELVRWRRGKIDFTPEAYEMNALVTFILSQSLEHVFARLSAGFGVEGKDVFRIAMKNEFLYPILLSTGMSKHYLAIATMQEGMFLHEPRKDIKGVGFRSSAYPKVIRDGFDAFVVNLFAEIEKGEKIRAASILMHVAELEYGIYKSIADRESDYLQTQSIKNREDYATPDQSTYFYYELWKAVFEEDYGEMVLPNKCFKIPLKQGKKLFRNIEFLEGLEKTHPKIHRNLLQFLVKYPKRDISAILVPPFTGKIDPFFVSVMDVRSHISQVMTSYYHILDALGIGTVDRNAQSLVSDFYDPSRKLII